MADVAVELDERAGVEQPNETLAREQLPGRALLLDGARAAGMQSLVAELAEPFELPLGRLVGSRPIVRRRHGRSLPRRFRR
jgi:hypothetical protein